MANQPAHEETQETKEYKLKKKIIEQEIERKKNSVVVSEWLEIIRNPQSTKGDKVCLVKRMKNGNKHRLYLGRTKQIPEQIEIYKAKGLEVKIF